VREPQLLPGEEGLTPELEACECSLSAIGKLDWFDMPPTCTLTCNIQVSKEGYKRRLNRQAANVEATVKGFITKSRKRALIAERNRKLVSSSEEEEESVSDGEEGSEEYAVSEEGCSGIDEWDGDTGCAVFDFTKAKRRMRPEFKLLVVMAPEGRDGLVRVPGMDDKPFNPRWDAGKTTLLILLESKDDTKAVSVLTPRGETQIAQHLIDVRSPKRTVLELPRPSKEGAEGLFDLQARRRQSVTRRQSNTYELQNANEATQMSTAAHKITHTAERSPTGKYNLGKGRQKAPPRTPESYQPKKLDDRTWKPWRGFQRRRPEDFAIETIFIRPSGPLSGSIGTHLEKVKGFLEQASVKNFEFKLGVAMKTHTIPRHLTFSLIPGHDLEMFIHTGGDALPDDKNFIWKSEFSGGNRMVVVRPTDVDYSAGTYVVSVWTTSRSADFELVCEVSPYSQTLRQVDPLKQKLGTMRKSFVSNNTTSMTGKGPALPKGLQAFAAEYKGVSRVLNNLMIYSNERARKSSQGASIPAKAELHLQRPSSSMQAGSTELWGTGSTFTMNSSRPGTSMGFRRESSRLSARSGDSDGESSDGGDARGNRVSFG